MAVSPLFVADTDTLQAHLRLSGLKGSSDGEAIFLRATSAARVYLYQRLGMSIVSEMVAQAEVDAPTSLVQIRRTACSLVEVELVRQELLDLMPVMVGDASGDAQQVYNDEGVWRSVTPEEKADILARSKARVEELLELILNEDELGDDRQIRAFDGSRASDTRRFPGGSAYPGIGAFPGNFEQHYHANGSNVAVRFELPAEDA